MASNCKLKKQWCDLNSKSCNKECEKESKGINLAEWFISTKRGRKVAEELEKMINKKGR